jgi:hypothetical protein
MKRLALFAMLATIIGTSTGCIFVERGGRRHCETRRVVVVQSGGHCHR